MQTFKVYSIRDAKGDFFGNPFFKRSHGEAERDFHLACNDEKSMLSKFPEDYDLYYLGEFEDKSGKFKPLDTPQHMLKAVHAVKVELSRGQDVTLDQ